MTTKNEMFEYDLPDYLFQNFNYEIFKEFYDFFY